MIEFDQTEIIDISPEITEELGVFPGDQPFQRKVVLSQEQGDNLLLSSITTTVHIGAHADSSSHYHAEGLGVEARNLNLYFGKCQVVTPKSIQQDGRIQSLVQDIVAPRVLIKSQSFPDPCHWNSDFQSLHPDLVERLAECGVRLIGIDTPSVDPESCKELKAHQKFYQYDLAVLEGIVLSHVEVGIYRLCALPLPIKGADASPVRAVLLRTS